MKTSFAIAGAVLAAALACGCSQPAPPAPFAVDLGGGARMEFVPIPAGTFLMGDAQGSPDARIVHKVTLSRGFFLGKYPVTQEQWSAVMKGNPSSSRGAKNPVDSVSWDGCQAFLAKLNARLAGAGAAFRLPTEAQWEYACRAGTSGAFFFGDDEAGLGDYAWFADNAAGRTHPVGLKRPNPWGLYDMYGNVWEWCSDWYAQDYYAHSPRRDPSGPADGNERVMRGGSWYRGAVNCRSADRYHGVAPCPDYGGGFRVLLPGTSAPIMQSVPAKAAN